MYQYAFVLIYILRNDIFRTSSKFIDEVLVTFIDIVIVIFVGIVFFTFVDKLFVAFKTSSHAIAEV